MYRKYKGRRKSSGVIDLFLWTKGFLKVNLDGGSCSGQSVMKESLLNDWTSGFSLYIRNMRDLISSYHLFVLDGFYSAALSPRKEGSGSSLCALRLFVLPVYAGFSRFLPLSKNLKLRLTVLPN